MSGNRSARLLQRRRGEPLRHSRLELSHAHEPGGASQIDVRQRDLVRPRAAGRGGRSAEIPRRAPLRRSAQGRAQQDRPQRCGEARLWQARRDGRSRWRAGFRFHGRLARHGGGRSGDQGARYRGGEGLPIRVVRRLGRRAHAGRHPLADANAAHHHRRAEPAGDAQALYRGPHQSDHRRRHRVLRDARRRAHCRAGRADRLRRPARHRANDPREAAGRFPARGISARPRHGRHGGAALRSARHHRPALPDIAEGAGRGGKAAHQPAGFCVNASRSGGMSIGAIQARLLALHPKRIDLSLARIERLLAALGHPEQHLPPVIHVAGTNGKGSTIAFARAILEAAGKIVHVYTSPNLVRLNERFRIGHADGGKLVGDAALGEVLAACEAKNGDAPITVFEMETAAAFLLFSRNPADVLLLEVGLGGRLDATNVVERPLASVITPVSIDHVEFLGDTLERIASEKAAILRREVPAVIADQAREALAVIERQAARMRAPLSIAGENWTATEERGRLVYQDGDGLLDLPAPRLYGRHQFENAGTAIAALRASGLKLPPAAFETGMTRVEWPARMQRLSHGKLPSLLPAESELWLDGGHNAAGGRVIAGALADLEERVPRPLVLIVGMLSTKDSEGFLKNFSGLARRVITVPIHQDKAVPAEDLAEIARRVDIPSIARDDLVSALAIAGKLDLEPAPRVLITGSLYLAGEVLAANGTPPE